MKSNTCLVLGLSIISLAGCVTSQSTKNNTTSEVFDYPESPRGPQVDSYHGQEVKDPYRWTEDMESAAVKKWVTAQNNLTLPYVKRLSTREEYRQRLTQLWSYEKYGVPFYTGGKYFYSYNDGLQNQAVLKVTDDLSREASVLLDPNSFSDDGTVALARYKVSPKGQYIAYGTSDGGTDWTSFRVKNINTGEKTTDLIEGTKFTGISWSPDEEGFYYSRYPKTAKGWDDSQAVSVYYHKLATTQSQDKLVFSLPENPQWDPDATVIADGQYLLINIFNGYEANAIYIKSLKGDGKVIKLFPDWDGLYGYVGADKGHLYFTSTADAKNGKVVSVSLDGDFTQKDVIDAGKLPISDVSLFGDKLIVQYLNKAASQVVAYKTDGRKIGDVDVPALSTIYGFYGGENSPQTFYKVTGFTNPGSIYSYDLKTGKSTVFKNIKVPIDLTQYVTRQVFYPSKDGTQVSMFLVQKKGLSTKSTHKTLLYGYGGFNVSLTPGYSAARMAWLENGHVVAIPNLRGGGEYGGAWHKAGTKLNKQNVFDDFIAAAQWLIDNGITSSEKLVVQGGSNGGLLIGAVMTQQPKLMAVALPAVGVLDMLRYHTASANARGWSSDFGISEKRDEYTALKAYSPVHNVEPGTCYPSTLITTGDHDDRVVPWHSYKFAAELQRAQSCDNPVLLRVETRGGHGAGKPTWMKIENYADQWAFAEQGTQ